MELFTPAAAVHAGLIPDQAPLVDFGQPKVSYDLAGNSGTWTGPKPLSLSSLRSGWILPR